MHKTKLISHFYVSCSLLKLNDSFKCITIIKQSYPLNEKTTSNIGNKFESLKLTVTNYSSVIVQITNHKER